MMGVMKISMGRGFMAVCVLSGVLLVPQNAQAQSGLDGVIRIQVGRNDGGVSNDELRQRVWHLEQAVQQLQMRVFSLEATGAGKFPAAPSMVTCFVKTPFKGTFSATEATETAAKAAVIQKCSAVIRHGFDCEEDKVRCGK